MKISELEQKKEVKEFLETYARNPQGFVLFSGKNGTGKSHAALSVYYRITPYILPAYDHDRAIFITQSDLNIIWSKEIAKYGDTIPLLDKFSHTKLLVLDDLGTRTPSEAFMDFLYSIADKRYSERGNKGTIITTNLNSIDMKAKFGDAFTSRVASGKCFRFDGKDRRFNQNDF